MNSLNEAFFNRDVLDVAPDLIGKVLVRKFESGVQERYTITETEAYRGEKDLACHASKGRTKRTEIMYHRGGVVYVYFIYGMYWLFNIVTSEKDYPAAVLIRGIEGCNGPGRLGRKLQIDFSFYGENLNNSQRIWVEDGEKCDYSSSERIGIGNSGIWQTMPWRYVINKEL